MINLNLKENKVNTFKAKVPMYISEAREYPLVPKTRDFAHTPHEKATIKYMKSKYKAHKKPFTKFFVHLSQLSQLVA